MAIAALRALPERAPPTSSRLATTVAGLHWPNPVGLAAGFDKDGVAVRGAFAAGFGAVEVGTLTPRPQAGNPRPRLFRLAEDGAVVNRMGFNNGGQAAALARLERARRRGPLGVNIGANKEAAHRHADYRAGAAAMAHVADYLAVNISSPNTPGLRALQDEGLDELLAGVMEAAGGTPVFLKVAPDLDRAQVDAIARAAADARLAGLIVSNTTVSRDGLRSRHGAEAGGLSGTPLKVLARARLAEFVAALAGALPVVSAGGIDGAEEAYARIRMGASAVQLYSALVFGGPGLVRRTVRGLERLLERDGFGNVGEAVGGAMAPDGGRPPG